MGWPRQTGTAGSVLPKQAILQTIQTADHEMNRLFSLWNPFEMDEIPYMIGWEMKVFPKGPEPLTW